MDTYYEDRCDNSGVVLGVSGADRDERRARLSDMYVEVALVQSKDVLQTAAMDDEAPLAPAEVLADQAMLPITSTSTRGPLRPADLFQRNTRRVLLKGQPGMGKTTFLNKLCTDWCAGRLSMFDGVFLLPLRDLSEGACRDMASVAEVLHTQLDDLMPRGFTYEDLKDLFKTWRDRVLILLDGYDEFDPACCPVINAFIQGTTTLARLVVTTRPSALESLQALTKCAKGKPFDTEADILGFGSAAQREYVGKFFYEAEHAELATSLRTQLQSSMMLRGLLQSPLMMRVACEMCLDRWTTTAASTVALPGSITKLFEEIKDLLIKRVSSSVSLRLSRPTPSSKPWRSCRSWRGAESSRGGCTFPSLTWRHWALPWSREDRCHWPCSLASCSGR